jgi:hypothetical protein
MQLPKGILATSLATGLATWLASGAATLATAASPDAAPLRVATFDVDATPPLGSAMAYDPVRRHDELSLRCRGVVLLGAGRPIVLCAVDWIGIGNEGHDAFRAALAEAADTSPERVAVHVVHQHDAPACDFTAERLSRELNLPELAVFDGTFARQVIQRAATAIRQAIPAAQVATHWGWGTAEVQQIASNRRLLGPDGKVRAVRYTATTDPELRAEPEGLVDRELSQLTFWNAQRPLAVLSYYACHPQSYYLTGIPSSDFPGIARFIRGQAVPDALHVHFNGAGGNIGAGKYNDGAPLNRMALALRLAQAMQQAYEGTHRHPLVASEVDWKTLSVQLPVAAHLDREQLIESLRNASPRYHFGEGAQLAWLERSTSGTAIPIGCLTIGQARVLHLPGELFVEYQLAAKALRPDLHVAMAAYGDYGPGYIGTAEAYAQGGYETSPRASAVAPAVEGVLMKAIQTLLQ